MRKISKQKELTGNHTQQMLFAEELATTTPLYPSNSIHHELERKFRNHIHEKINDALSYVGNKNG